MDKGIRKHIYNIMNQQKHKTCLKDRHSDYNERQMNVRCAKKERKHRKRGDIRNKKSISIRDRKILRT